uniref:Uncharacterized protein n=1 Tax=Arundo donax TaxID=35708 RepID=A0A0A9GWH4_ARUDO
MKEYNQIGGENMGELELKMGHKMYEEFFLNTVQT